MSLTREEKNSLAYDDCSKFEEPSMPDDPEYMDLYRYWREIARFPEDLMYEFDSHEIF